MSATLNIRSVDGVVIADVSGRLTLGEGATTLRDTAQALISSGNRSFLLNLAGLTYMDSSGIGALVSVYATMNRHGGHVKLVNLSTRVKDLLLITKLYTVFEIFDDEASALKSFVTSTVKASAGNA